MNRDQVSVSMGFVILSHDQNPLLKRLVSRLDHLYGNPPIVIHHDYSQTDFPFPELLHQHNISMVKPHLPTGWGQFSIIEAFLCALDLLFERYAPDWFTNLSPSCYPVASGSTVMSELEATKYDAFVGSVEIYPEFRPPSTASVVNQGELLFSPSLPTHTSDIEKWMRACLKRYVMNGPGEDIFSKHFRCYVGDQWVTANRSCARALLQAKSSFPSLVCHYSNVHVPDESFFQTVLGNSIGIATNTCNKRFVNWQTKDAHPVFLDYSDIQFMQTSQCFFARKLSPDSSLSLLNALDRLCNEDSKR